ncbi:MAG: sulfur oxidation c-type cytochrome SoxX [Methylococcaceae bacterium]|nr:sulfur oxidation c-type cytochrome SoxX [Methylococcaceae bacterium]
MLVGCTSAEIQANKPLNEGKQLAFTRSKGNCLACHAIDDGELAGNIAPELKNISQRFKTKLELKHFIWDATVFNSETVMPPFGKNKILSESEIDKIVDYLWQL